ncbi:hypothetical protein ABXN37_27370 [Piscinibacter sakaiensis]|uniref:hypothetical protein n=1 Tax=Piscinibacter sakaiensis TaxID=1547922 RepID=UPI0012FA4F41|nr:hypothetical protein [Piscinibacter sakaiensis]
MSHFAQFGLFLFTVGSLYFTVIPLYQKAVLEEAIAKREIELKALNDRFDAAYKRLRASAVRDFQMLATPHCAGLYNPPRAATLQASAAEERTPRAVFVFSVDVRSCLTNVASETRALSDLSAADRRQFDEELSKVIGRLEAKKASALEEYSKIPAELTDAEAEALPADSYRVRHLELMARVRGREAMRLARRRLAADLKREEVGSDYERSITEELLVLRRTAWRTDSP